MRELVSLENETAARRLAATLQVSSVPATVEEEDSQWVVWIENDDDREKAEQTLARFQENPDAEEFSAAVGLADKQARAEAKKHAEMRRRQIDLSKRWGGSWWHAYPSTQIITVLCIAVVVLTTDWQARRTGMFGLPDTCDKIPSPLLDALFFQAPTGIDFTESGGAYRYWEPQRLKEILKTGELWRLVTPAFIHFGVVHILFNMMWLRSMGMAIEFVRGTRRFLGIVLITAVVSHTAQFVWSGPAFGGMSGVVYGLIGYVWMRGRTMPQMGLGLTPNQVVYAILWLVLCMGGAFGPIANAAHLGGFIAGMLIGGRQALWRRIMPSDSGGTDG